MRGDPLGAVDQVGRGGVQRGALGGRDRLVDGLLDERVGEAVAAQEVGVRERLGGLDRLADVEAREAGGDRPAAADDAIARASFPQSGGSASRRSAIDSITGFGVVSGSASSART